MRPKRVWSGQLPTFGFELIPARGKPPFSHASLGGLQAAIRKRLPLVGLSWRGKIDHDVVVKLTLDLEGKISQDQARGRLQKVMVDLDRKDITVVNA